MVEVRDTFCSYGVMELCSKGLGTSTSALRAKGINLSCVRTLCVIAEERPRINLTTNFAKLFSALNLTPRAVSTSFGCRVNVGICLQVHCFVGTVMIISLQLGLLVFPFVYSSLLLSLNGVQLILNSMVCSRPYKNLRMPIIFMCVKK